MNITEYIVSSDGASVSAQIQRAIDENPNRTIYFPDGEYRLSEPIRTPADPRKSVSLKLDSFAVLTAADDFEGEALVMLGGKDPFNDTHTPGSNYSLTGGVIDPRGKAKAITIESGRETVVKDVSVKNATVGIHIKYGANSGSSDADISSVNIIGTGDVNSVGLLVEGYDNTFTNIRIGYVFTGVHIKSAGNSLKNIHPLYYSGYADYEQSVGFLDEGNDNLYDYCYSDQFCTGFRTTGYQRNIYTNCFTYWYSGDGGKETCFQADKEFDSTVTNMRIGFSENTKNCVLKTGGIGVGVFDRPIVDATRVSGNYRYLFYSSSNPLTPIRRAVYGLVYVFKHMK
ncbi:MAG: hypothetical protein IJU96_07370 [Clostridia bacterium]|nr:hypothetical protein [Clostridia bacterium]